MTTVKTTTAQTPAVRQDKNIVDQVLSRVNQFVQFGEMNLPKDYSPENALKSAYLILQETVDKDKKPVLESCSKESIANALLDMVVQGLSPMKKQCAFIAFGGKLTFMREYPGTIALARRFANLKDFSANVIYEGDIFKYSADPKTGRKEIIEHVQELENINIAKIKGAYAVLMFDDKLPHVEIMTMQQVQTAWKQGYGGGATEAHTKFTDQMALKTVINRACKYFINSSDDGNLHLEDKESDVKTEIREAQRETISMYDYQEAEEVKEVKKEQPKEEPKQVEKQEKKEEMVSEPKMGF